MLENIKILIKEKDVCVLSTISKDAAPHSSFMAYITGENCREIYMATHSTTKKYKNMLKTRLSAYSLTTEKSNPAKRPMR
jgi:general stress protein 26